MNFTQPEGDDRAEFLNAICNKNHHSAIASTIMAKHEHFFLQSKNFNYSVQYLNHYFYEKSLETAFSGEINLDAIFQLF